MVIIARSHHRRTYQLLFEDTLGKYSSDSAIFTCVTDSSSLLVDPVLCMVNGITFFLLGFPADTTGFPDGNFIVFDYYAPHGVFKGICTGYSVH